MDKIIYTKGVQVKNPATVVGFVCLMLFSLQSGAASLQLQNLSSDDMNKVVGDLSTNFMHTSVSGASSLGHLFGFEVGLVGGQGNTPNLQDVVHETDATVTANKVPYAALLGALSVPFGITAEIGFVPKVGNDEFKYGTTSLAAKWTPTDLFLDLPFSLAGKLSYTSTALEFHETVSGVATSYKFNDKITNFTALISKNFVVVEPYFGLGVASASGDLSATGSSTVFKAGTSGSASRSSTVWLVGAEVKLLVVKLGAEYTNAFGTSRYTGKLSFFF